MSKQILLTISILISNRPDTVKKCLDSVKPLLEKIPSELILVDTGCGEAVRAIIEEYTDQIIDFEWCRDFSKARNAGLKRAKGKWFLYLDDDEWFEDVADIVRFFKSGEYMAYGVGLYTQRNYLAQDGSEYTELLVGRMIRLEPDIKFIHKVHECFNRAPGMPRKLEAYVHHYGYIYQSSEAHEAHARRNISLLKEELDEHPRNMRSALQLAQEYNSVGDWEKSLALSVDSIAKAEEGPVEDEYCLAPLYANEINCYIGLERFDEAIDRGGQHLKNRRADKMVKALIAGQLTVAYLEKEDWGRCLECAEYYRDIFRDYLQNDEEYMEYNLPVTNTCFHERRRVLFLGNGVRAAIRLGKDAAAWQCFQGIGWEGRRGYVDTEVIRDILGRMQTAGGEGRKLYGEMCNIFLGHEEWRDFILQEMMEICANAESFSERIKAAAAYRDVSAEHWLPKLIRLVTAAFLPDAGSGGGKAENAYTAEEAQSIAAEIWNRMEESMPLMKACDMPGAVRHFGGDNRQVLESIPFLRWERGITWYFSRFSWKDALWWDERLRDILEPEGIRMLAWRAAYGISRANGADADIQAVLEGLTEFGLCRTALCERIYREKIIREMPDILPEEDQGAYKVRKMLEWAGEGRYAEAVGAAREVRDLLPGIANIMKQYLKWLEKQMEREKEESRQAAGEFQVLARQIKVKLYALSEAGQYQEALAVAEQMLVLMPEDKEILQIKKKILKMN